MMVTRTSSAPAVLLVHSKPPSDYELLNSKDSILVTSESPLPGTKPDIADMQ